MNLKSLRLRPPKIWLDICISFLARIPETKIPSVYYTRHGFHTRIKSIGIFNDQQFSRLESLYFFQPSWSQEEFQTTLKKGYTLDMSSRHPDQGDATGSQVLITWAFLFPHSQSSDPRSTNTLAGERLVRWAGMWNLDTRVQNPYRN